MNQSGSVLVLNEWIMKNSYEIPPCSTKKSKLLYLFLDVKSKDMKFFSNNRFPTTYIQVFRNNTVHGS